MAKNAGKAYDINLLKRIYTYIKPYKKQFIWCVVLTVLLAILAPLRPFLIQYALDEYVFENDAPGLGFMAIVLVLLLVLQTIVQYFHTFLTNKLGQSTIRDLRINVFNHITKLRLRFFDRTPIGQLITRTVSDLETIADIFSEGLISTLR